MISTTTIIFPPAVLWLPTNGEPSPTVQIHTFLFFQTLLHRAMLNNEQDYPEPHEFKPEHFLKNGKLDGSVRDPMEIAFGFGRRWALFILSIGPYLIITVLPDFALDNISLIQLLHSLLCPFCCESYAITPPRKLSTPVSVPTSAILPNQTATDYNKHYHNRSASQRQSSHLQVPHTSVDNRHNDNNSNDN